MLYFPVDAVLAETGKDIHLHRPVVTTEHTGKSVAKRHHCTIEDTVGRRNMVTSDKRDSANNATSRPHNLPDALPKGLK